MQEEAALSPPASIYLNETHLVEYCDIGVCAVRSKARGDKKSTPNRWEWGGKLENLLHRDNLVAGRKNYCVNKRQLVEKKLIVIKYINRLINIEFITLQTWFLSYSSDDTIFTAEVIILDSTRVILMELVVYSTASSLIVQLTIQVLREYSNIIFESVYCN